MLKSLIKQYHKFPDVTVYLNFDKHINAVVKKGYPCCYLAISVFTNYKFYYVGSTCNNGSVGLVKGSEACTV
jgi:hypothetical protein